MEARQRKGKRDSTSQYLPGLAGFARLAEGDFHACLAASSGVAVVLFSAPGCGACRAWKLSLPQALADVAQAFYEVDASEATGVVRCFGIFHLPTVYLYRDGQFHAELQCEARRDRIRATTHSLLDKPAQDEP
jgi:thioredoxin 1